VAQGVVAEARHARGAAGPAPLVAEASESSGSPVGESSARRRFVDETVRGPFTAFQHEHAFEAYGSGTRMTDVVTFGTPLRLLAERPIGVYLRRLLTTRNATIRRKAERARS